MLILVDELRRTDDWEFDHRRVYIVDKERVISILVFLIDPILMAFSHCQFHSVKFFLFLSSLGLPVLLVWTCPKSTYLPQSFFSSVEKPGGAKHAFHWLIHFWLIIKELTRQIPKTIQGWDCVARPKINIPFLEIGKTKNTTFCSTASTLLSKYGIHSFVGIN